MSRLDRKIGDCAEGPVDAAEILAAMAKERGGCPRERREAVSRYLSGADDWREASAHLDGAFAAKEEWLRPDEQE